MIGRCLMALVVGAWGGLASAQTEGELAAVFPEKEARSTAFVVAGGREVVSLGVAGWSLSEGRLEGGSVEVDSKMADRVSRLIVFRTKFPVGLGLGLANQAPMGGSLHFSGDEGRARIVGRVEQVGGKYLPFTLMKLSCSGSLPRPGTPLLDAQGKVAGIVYDKKGKATLYALPVEVLRRVLDDARGGGVVRRIRLGIRLNPAQGSSRISKVEEDSPASRVGLQEGDVLVEIGGRKVGDYGDAVNAIYLLKPGVETTVKVKRGSSKKVVTLIPEVCV